jgi:hypothetical protein
VEIFLFVLDLRSYGVAGSGDFVDGCAACGGGDERDVRARHSVPAGRAAAGERGGGDDGGDDRQACAGAAEFAGDDRLDCAGGAVADPGAARREGEPDAPRVDGQDARPRGGARGRAPDAGGRNRPGLTLLAAPARRGTRNRARLHSPRHVRAVGAGGRGEAGHRKTSPVCIQRLRALIGIAGMHMTNLFAS